MDTNVFYLYDDQRILTQALELPVTDPAPLALYTLVPAPQVELPQVARFVEWLNDWEVLDERPPRPVPSAQPWEVDQEKERRVALGFVYDGKAFVTENQSQIDDILGMMTDSLAAITVDGAYPGNLHWASAKYEFSWPAADGTRVPMDAQTCLDFTRTAARRKSLLVAAGLALKAMDPIPADYMADKYWPPMDVTASRHAE